MTASDILTASDPLIAAGAPERVNYATGVLLQADDFRDEQTYHRSRLASALQHLAGFGTIAGLAVRAPLDGDADLHLRVEAGLAIDRYGRLIEVGEPWCIRLVNWMAARNGAELRAAITPKSPSPGNNVLTADLFLSARVCGHGKTPSFASGPFDALDALVPARLAEMPQFELVLRSEGAPDTAPLPTNFWPDAAASRDSKLAAVLGSWPTGADQTADGSLPPLAEHVGGHDTSAVFLARIVVPVALPAPEAPPEALPQFDPGDGPGRKVTVDNSRRPFVFLPGKWLGRAPTRSS